MEKRVQDYSKEILKIIRSNTVPIYPCPQDFAIVVANLRAFSACLVNCLSMSSPICFHHIRQKSHQ